MIKKCNNCNTENPRKAKFCRMCGLSFEDIPITSEELENIRLQTKKWKSYDQWKKPKTGFVLRGLLSIIVLLLSAFVISNILHNLGQDKMTQIVVSCVVGFILFVIIIYHCRKQLPTEQEEMLFPSIYDKVEPYYYTGIRHSRKRKLYKIFLKDEKMGVLDVCNYRVVIAPNYSLIKWKKKQSILTVTLNNDTFDINTKGEFL